MTDMTAPTNCKHDEPFRILGTGETAGFVRVAGWEAWERFCEAHVAARHCAVVAPDGRAISTIRGRIYMAIQ